MIIEILSLIAMFGSAPTIAVSESDKDSKKTNNRNRLGDSSSD